MRDNLRESCDHALDVSTQRLGRRYLGVCFRPPLAEGTFHTVQEVGEVFLDQCLQGGKIEGLIADESILEKIMGNLLRRPSRTRALMGNACIERRCPGPPGQRLSGRRIVYQSGV